MRKAKAKNQVRERVGQYRARMKARGMRQVNLWLPDTTAPGFAKEMRRQSLAIAKSDRREGILEELDAAVRDVEGWEA